MLLSALSVGEKFSLGGTTTLLGLGMTFIVLAILIGCVYLVNVVVKLLSKINKNNKRNAVKKDKSAVIEAVSEEDSGEDKKIDDETMAAIRAAVDIYVKENSDDGKPHDKTTILSVKEL